MVLLDRLFLSAIFLSILLETCIYGSCSMKSWRLVFKVYLVRYHHLIPSFSYPCRPLSSPLPLSIFTSLDLHPSLSSPLFIPTPLSIFPLYHLYHYFSILLYVPLPSSTSPSGILLFIFIRSLIRSNYLHLSHYSSFSFSSIN